MYAIETYGYIFFILIFVGIVLLIAACGLWLAAKRMVQRDKEAYRLFLIETYGIECCNRAAKLSPQEMPDRDLSTRKEVAS